MTTGKGIVGTLVIAAGSYQAQSTHPLIPVHFFTGFQKSKWKMIKFSKKFAILFSLTNFCGWSFENLM